MFPLQRPLLTSQPVVLFGNAQTPHVQHKRPIHYRVKHCEQNALTKVKCTYLHFSILQLLTWLYFLICTLHLTPPYLYFQHHKRQSLFALPIYNVHIHTPTITSLNTKQASTMTPTLPCTDVIVQYKAVLKKFKNAAASILPNAHLMNKDDEELGRQLCAFLEEAWRVRHGNFKKYSVQVSNIDLLWCILFACLPGARLTWAVCRSRDIQTISTIA